MISLRIAEKLAAKAADNWNAPAVTIAFLGDSVTQGCFEVYLKGPDAIETVYDKNHAYHNYLAQILTMLYPGVPVNIINAGISGGSAPHGLERLERDVLSRKPDLTVVCFGLNDSGAGEEGIVRYTEALDGIFARLAEEGIETIFMTPNMMCTGVSVHLRDELPRQVAESCARTQNSGMLEKYLEAAKEVCAGRGVTVCDCYAKWKALARSGADVTELLANKINHPTREMNWMFAYSLVETMLMN